jgi:hypothetical protein
MCGLLVSELRYCCTAGDLRSYWCSRFHWSSSQVALIDPIGTQKAVSKLSPDAKRRIQKLRCGWLLVNRQVAREDSDRDKSCKACSPGNLVEETVDHILQCQHQPRRDAVHDRFAGMSKTLRSWKTSHLIIDALRAGALVWIDGNPAPAAGTLHLPKTPSGQLVHQAYAEQTSLGWNLLFRGFWTFSWRTAQEYELSHCPFTPEFQDNGARWAGRAQIWMFDLFEVAWGLRNATEHGAGPDTQRMIRLAKAERAIRRLYRAIDKLPPHERFPFSDPTEDLLATSVSTQERWVSLTEAYLPKAFKRIKKQ